MMGETGNANVGQFWLNGFNQTISRLGIEVGSTGVNANQLVVNNGEHKFDADVRRRVGTGVGVQWNHLEYRPRFGRNGDPRPRHHVRYAPPERG